MIVRWLTLALLSTASCLAQAPEQFSPKAAYEQATRPIEIVHRSIGNWSESEVASLAVAIKNGAEACAARKPEDFAGEELIAYARLCSLGVNWPAVDVAATQYIESKDDAKPQLALAYGMKLEAVLQSHSVPQIMATAKAMLAANPYDATVDTAANEAFDYLQLAYTSSALELHGLREPILLAQLAQAAPVLPLHVLYSDALTEAALQQYAGKPDEAAVTLQALEAALTVPRATPVPPDELLLIAALRRQYSLLGKPLPKLDLQLSLATLKPQPTLDPEAAASTAYLLFPPWCAQCVRMSATGLVNASDMMAHGAVKLYALLAEPAPDAGALTPDPKKLTLPTPEQRLLHTPTIVVPPATIDLVSATDFPYLLVVDHAGILRFAGVAPETALKNGDFVDRATDHVAEQWPSKFVPVAPAPARGSPVK